MKIITRVIRDLHVKKATKQCRNDADDDTECIYRIYNIQQAVRIQRENRSKKIIIVHSRIFDITSIFNTSDILQDNPI